MTAGTLLDRARISLRVVVFIAWNLAQEVQPSARALSRALGIRLETVWRWCHRLRAAHCLTRRPLTDTLHHQPLRLRLQQPPPHARPMPPDPRYRWRFVAPVRVVTDAAGDNVQAWVGESIVEPIRRVHGGDLVPFALGTRLTGRAGRVRDEILHQIRYVAFGVTMRWLQRYLSFACCRQACPRVDQLLVRALRGPVTRFEGLRPGTSPLDTSFEPQLQDVRAFSWAPQRRGTFLLAPSA